MEWQPLKFYSELQMLIENIKDIIHINDTEAFDTKNSNSHYFFLFISEDICIIWKQAKILINAQNWLTEKSIVTEFIFSPTILNVFYACNEEFHALVDIGFNNKTGNTFFYCQAVWCVLIEM